MLKPINLNDIPKHTHGPKVFSVKDEIRQFYNSGHEACEIILNSPKSENSTRTEYKKAAETLNLPIIVFIRKGRVFMARTDNTKAREVL